MSLQFPSFTKKYHKTPYETLDATLPALSQAGKNIVITGGGTGIGAATALRFAQAGASTVSIIGRRASLLESTKKNIEAAVPGSKIYSYTTDITQKDEIRATFKSIHDLVGDIHVFVSNAGYLSTPSPLKDAEDEEWWRSFEINVRGTFLATQAFLHFKAENSALLYVSSGAAHVLVGRNSSAYSASKAGAVRFLNTVQIEHPEVRVVILHPGMVPTEMTIKSQHTGVNDDPALAGGVMVWLSTPEADFLKGKFIWANWDVDEMKARADEIAKSDLLSMKLSGWPFDQKSS